MDKVLEVKGVVGVEKGREVEGQRGKMICTKYFNNSVLQIILRKLLWNKANSGSSSSNSKSSRGNNGNSNNTALSTATSAAALIVAVVT